LAAEPRALNRGSGRLCLLLGALLLLGCGGGAGVASAPASPPVDVAALVMVETGSLPIILSAPHGGTLLVPGVPERTQGTTVLDTHTLELVQTLQAELVKLTGQKAQVVAARVSRKQVDFNRKVADALENPAMAPVYAAYHDALRAAVATVKTKPGALLLDLHGQGNDPTLIYRGTQGGATANLSLLYASPQGLLHGMLGQGLTLSPATADPSEHPDFNGGYIVGTYGISAGGVSAVQLEFGLQYRDPQDQVAATATKLATALKAHLVAAGVLTAFASKP